MRRGLLAVLLLTGFVAFAAEPAQPSTPEPAPTATPEPREEEFVFFNWKSKKFHCAACDYAKQCTKNCSYVEKSKALESGGKPCGSCKGTCRR